MSEDTLQKKRPAFLSIIVLLMCAVDLMEFSDITSILSTEFFFYSVLSLLMVPLYIALYRGMNWSRLIFICLSILAVISGILNYSSMASSYRPWRLALFYVEVVIYFIFLIYAFLAPVRHYFQTNLDIPVLKGEWLVSPLWRRLLGLLLDWIVAFILFVPIHYFSLSAGSAVGKALSFIVPLAYISFSSLVGVNLSRYVLGIRVVYLCSGKIAPFFALLRVIYGLLLMPFNCLFVLIDPYSRGAHDYICRSVVVVKK